MGPQLIKQVFFAILTAAAILPAAELDFSFVDLSSVANRSFLEWFGQGEVNDLASFSSGDRVLEGVPYQIREGERAAVILRGRDQKELPLDTGAIPVGKRAGALYFLTACGWNAGIGETVMLVNVRYREAGLYLEIPLRYQFETGGWWRPEAPALGKVAWQGRNRSADIGVYSFGWLNPHPNEVIESISVSSPNGTAVPALLAVTLANRESALQELRERNKKNAESGKPAAGPIRLRADFAAPGVPARDDVASLAIGFNQLPEYRRAAAHLAAAGKHKPFIRLQINIAEPSPAESVWEFEKLDRYLEFIEAAGGEPMLCFGPGGPIWMADPEVPGTLKANWRPRIPEEYYAYCESIFRRYALERAKPVLWWQIGNETELKGWSYQYYADLYKALAPRLRQLAPFVKIGGPVTCNPNLGWARELLREAGNEVDFLSYHQYGYSEPFDSPDDYVMARTNRYRETAAEYRKLAKEFGRDLPVIVSEANTNPRFQRPAGTDPRIRSPFNAAWYFSTLCRFAEGGGTALCYFTLDGGFGACQFEKGRFTLYPVYHALWLFRRTAGQRLIPAESESSTLEGYAFLEEGKRSFAVINKSARPIEVRLEGIPDGNWRMFSLCEESAAACRYLTAAGEFPVLPEKKMTAVPKEFQLTGYEVRVWIQETK